MLRILPSRVGLAHSTWPTAVTFTKNHLIHSGKHQRYTLQRYFSLIRRLQFSHNRSLSSETHLGELKNPSFGEQKQFARHDMSRVQQDFSRISEGLKVEPGTLNRAKGKIPHVGIIGAGVSGLRCADILLKHGVKVTILEARDRIGGRFCQSDALGYRVDLEGIELINSSGPNWIHGTENNPILDLTKETDTKTISWDGRQAVFDQLGALMSDSESAENNEIVWGIIQQAMEYSNEECDTISPDASLYDYYKEKVVTMVTSGSEEEVAKKRQTILHMAEMWGAFVGSPVETQSLKFFWMEDSLDEENLFVAETYHKVLKKIAEPALKGADIKFGYKVKKITSRNASGQPSVSVESWDKESLNFDEVVTTTPLGWLKANMNIFEPELPIRLHQAITSIGYGHLDKVYITFPTAFWQDTPVSTTAPINESPSTEQTPGFPGFTNWIHPTYASSPNPSAWSQEGMNLAALPAPHAHPTILFYTSGPTSKHIASLLKSFPSPIDTSTSPAAMSILLPFFRPYFSRLPNYNAEDPAHQPVAMLATAWANDELAGYGSYSNFQVGLQRGGEDVEVMRKGMPERGVWIAGEHTAPVAGLGTVNGAYWSGEGVGKRIVRAYGLVEDE